MSDQEYTRGHDAGVIAERLDGHDKHLAKINGSMERVADELHKLTMATQRLADQASADALTRVATASALKEAADVKWSPLTRAFAILAGVSTLVSVALALLR